jgi:hypothetical protein
VLEVRERQALLRVTVADGNWEMHPVENLTSTLQVLAARLGGGDTDRRDSSMARTNASSGAEAVDALMSPLIAMPLDVFARNGQWLEVRVPWVKVTLWFVPEERDAETLGGEGVHRGRVWTARELIGVMAITGRSEALPSITLAKLTFDGDIAEAITEKGQ